MSQLHTTDGPIYSSLSTDPDLCELVEQLVDAIPDRIASLNSAFQANDMSALETYAHQLKGTLGSYGFDQCTPYALQLEQRVKGRKPEDEICESLEHLVAICRRLTAEPE